MNTILQSLIDSSSSTDISNYCSVFQSGNFLFSSPYIKPLVKGYNTLIYNSTTIPMTERYMYRPDYVSYDYYNTCNLWYVILYVNDVQSITQFNIRNIIVPNLSIINTLYSQNKVNTNVINQLVPGATGE